MGFIIILYTWLHNTDAVWVAYQWASDKELRVLWDLVLTNVHYIYINRSKLETKRPQSISGAGWLRQSLRKQQVLETRKAASTNNEPTKNQLWCSLTLMTFTHEHDSYIYSSQRWTMTDTKTKSTAGAELAATSREMIIEVSCPLQQPINH
ncbi:hypothetical protein CBL_14595 [Carabus blaptoides fortunei]